MRSAALTPSRPVRDLVLSLLILAGCAASIACAGGDVPERALLAVAAATLAVVWCLVASVVWGAP